jgi:hypothetical protein
MQAKRDNGAGTGGGEIHAPAGSQRNFNQGCDRRIFVSRANQRRTQERKLVDRGAVIHRASAANTEMLTM